MILYKITQGFLLPSVFIWILILIGVSLLSWKRYQKIGKKIIILGILLYYLFSTALTSDLILAPLENQYQTIRKEEINNTNRIILLLGNEESSFLRAGEVLRLYLFGEKPFEIIISGRDPLFPQNKIGERVKGFLVTGGIPPDNIILEEESKTTRESAKNVKQRVGKEPFFLVTSAYHMKRVMETFQKEGANPIPAPTDFKRKEQYDILDFFPDAQNLRNSDLAFHEYFGIIFYRFYY